MYSFYFCVLILKVANGLSYITISGNVDFHKYIGIIVHRIPVAEEDRDMRLDEELL